MAGRHDRRCPHCGAFTPAGTHWFRCTQCGTPLAATPTTAADLDEPEGADRLVEPA